MPKKKSTRNSGASQPSNRIFAEMLETAVDLYRHGLMAKEDIAELEALCNVPAVALNEKY